MIRALATALALSAVTAPNLSADTYQGLTIGMPVPDTAAPLTSELWRDRPGGTNLVPPLSTICTHVFLSGGQGAIYGASFEGCDGPVLRIRAVEPVEQFIDPAGVRGAKMDTGIAGLSFDTTTLADLRALFGSEGLTGGRFGLDTPDFIGGYTLAYELDGTDTLAVFFFQNPEDIMSLDTLDKPFAPETRDTALLLSIELISPQFFDIIGDEWPTVPSANYTPLSGLFTQ